MKIIVTGAGGFLGSRLCARLERDGHQFTRVSTGNCDLRNSEALHQFDNNQYDMIYHLAAWTQAGDFCLYHPGAQWLANQLINAHVLAWWAARQPQAKMVALGSSCCYPPDMELREENFMKGEPIDSLYTYAMTKRMLYAGLLALHRQFNLNYICLVPSTLYGPGYHLGGRQMHFIFDLIRKIIDAKLNGSEVILWGDGHQKRELIYIDDFISVLQDLVAGVNNELVNIGGGEEYTIREFAAIICEMVDYDPGLIQYDATRYVGAKSKVLNIDKLRRLLPGFCHTPLRKGLARTVGWYLEASSRAGLSIRK